MRLAIDIGGTFTDLAAYDPETGELVFTKSSTTPRKLTEAVLSCVGGAQIETPRVETFIHGSTVGINTIIQRSGPRTALITTEGFRDVYEMGRRNRPEIYDLFFHRPRPLVPRDLRFEVAERLDARGAVVRDLDESQTRQVLDEIGGDGIQALAVCLLHSYANPDHEQRIGSLARGRLPDVFVSVSSDIHREYREYERTSTVVMNAYLGPVVGRYLEQLESEMRSINFSGNTLIMQSSGGVMNVASAARQPVRTIESGPAGGVAGALYLCESLGLSKAIAFDMGGTTAKACVIDDGQAAVTTDYYVGGRVSGLPAQVPFLDIIEIGAGGGSIAWVDPVGALKVGPNSAGAEPGPAAYGLGGTEPTVTDANVVIGHIDAERFLGGDLPLDPSLSRAAIDRVGSQVGMDTLEMANGIVRIANAMMARALSKVSVQQGYDPRDFVLIAYGGGGPMHAVAVARELRIPTVVIPQAPSQFSALGMLCTDMRYDYARTYPVVLGSEAPEDLETQFAELEAVALEQLRESGAAQQAISFTRSADMRYVGQFHTLTVGVPRALRSQADISALDAKFHAAHETAYGHAAAGEPTELISIRVAAFVKVVKPTFHKLERGVEEPAGEASLGSRDVLGDDGTYRSCPVYQRERLLAGNVIHGPTIIQEKASVLPLGTGDVATIDSVGHIVISVKGDN